MRDDVVRDLERARARTLELTDLDEPTLLAQHDPLMSPLVWDLAHIGQQEELWLLRGGDPARPGLLPPDVDSLYDAFKHRRADRPPLPLLPPVEARAFDHEVRGRVLDLLERTARGRDLFTAGMVVQHEEQHDETMFATLQLRQGPPVLLDRAPAAAGPSASSRRARASWPAARSCSASTRPSEPFSLDNERPAHTVDVGAVLDRPGAGDQRGSGASSSPTAAITGRDLWSERGWAHRVRGRPGAAAVLDRATAPGAASGSRRTCRPDEPVQHVCYFEAEAFARWARRPAADRDRVGEGLRLGPGRRGPGGPGRGARAPPGPELANLGGAGPAPAPVGAYPAGASAYGVEQLIGDVWEWTSSDFRPWPGFTPMIYRAYSEPFFGGDYKVLRGGSWAVAPSAIRPSFRNWDHPIRRQIFTGVRLAWDA